MTTDALFKWHHFLPEIIVLDVRWYCRYSLSYRNLKEMMAERGVEVDYSTINRWVLKFAPEFDRRIRPFLNPANDSWRVDETYIEVKGEWKYLYQAVDFEGNTLDFMLSAKRDGKAARFFRKILGAKHTHAPRVITVDKKRFGTRLSTSCGSGRCTHKRICIRCRLQARARTPFPSCSR